MPPTPTLTRLAMLVLEAVREPRRGRHSSGRPLARRLGWGATFHLLVGRFPIVVDAPRAVHDSHCVPCCGSDCCDLIEWQPAGATG